jgi:hypothetical protein
VALWRCGAVALWRCKLLSTENKRYLISPSFLHFFTFAQFSPAPLPQRTVIPMTQDIPRGAAGVTMVEGTPMTGHAHQRGPGGNGWGGDLAERGRGVRGVAAGSPAAFKSRNLFVDSPVALARAGRCSELQAEGEGGREVAMDGTEGEEGEGERKRKGEVEAGAETVAARASIAEPPVGKRSTRKRRQ